VATKLQHATWALFGDISQAAILELYKLASATAPHHHVLLLIDTEGGLANATIGCVQMLQRKFPTLETRAVASCMSAGVDLLMAGTLRTAIPTAEFMTHPPTESFEVRPESGPERSALAKSSHEWTIRFYTKHTARGLRFWRSFFSRDRWFGAREAKRLGIVHKIIS
jgi:ATP-dependent protease ClpP protease subunit